VLWVLPIGWYYSDFDTAIVISMSINDLIRKVPNHDELNLAYREIELQDSDRASAIIAAAYLEDVVKFALSRCFVELTGKEYDALFGSSGPLFSFSAAINVGYALGIYGKIARNDLDNIRKLRNVFAHAMVPVSFYTTEIIQIVDNLKYLQWKIDQGVTDFFFGGAQDIANPARQKYAKTCRILINDLMNTSLLRRPNDAK
jgi:DNA-binding MltR family transcriptional regulator